MLALSTAFDYGYESDGVRALRHYCAPFPYWEPSEHEKEEHAKFIEFVRSFMPQSANAGKLQPVETAEESADVKEGAD